MIITNVTLFVLCVFHISVEFQKTSSGECKWSLTDIADHTQLGSPARLATKRRMIQSASSQGNMDGTVRRLEQQLQEYRTREKQLDRRADDANRRAEDSQRRAAELQTQVVESNTRAEALLRQSQESEDRVQHVERSLAETRQSLRQSEERHQIPSTHWAVRREEIELTGPQLGVGGWATVTVAKFRGAQVAVKRIHNQIISRHNIQLFQREMNIAARLRHPNLIQFIGATMEGEMMIIMELIATSLRSQLEAEEYFLPKWVKAISLDVALGLNYLHLIQPDPIVHRDISSANVLLEQLPLNK